MKKNVLIAGIGGASLGTEIFKSLHMTGRYNVYGADISPYAFGLYQDGFTETFVIDKGRYADSLLHVCKEAKIDAVIPGAERTLALINHDAGLFLEEGILLAINSPEIIEICTDKAKTFNFLKSKKVPIPLSRFVTDEENFEGFRFPCIIKPSHNSGGSSFAYIAENKSEAHMYAEYLRGNDIKCIAQEYIPCDEGEYTVGVLTLPNGELVGSIALRRLLDSKLSLRTNYKNRIVSSGYSQGVIDDFSEIRQQAEKIAKLLESRGPLNIQGRVRDGIFYPFEINPRFSASTYLRAMAGFNEIDIYLQFILHNKKSSVGEIRHGYYLRSLDEQFISFGKIKKSL